MEDYKLSPAFLSECSTEKLLQINTYLMARHSHHFRYENYDNLEMLVDFMDEIDNEIFERFTNGEKERN